MEKLKRILNTCLVAIKNGTFLKKANNALKIRINNLLGHLFTLNTKVNPNKILFCIFQGRYECNAKAICNEIINRNLPYELVWLDKNNSNVSNYPQELKIVKYNSIKCYKELACAKIIIINGVDIMNLKFKKKKEQVIIQTWHGSMGFKKLETFDKPNWQKKAVDLGSMTDYIISNSIFEEEVYRSTYWKKSQLLKYGHPRNDILFNKDKIKDYNKKIRKIYNINEDDNILLYAPTFRNDLEMNVYNLDYNKIINALENKFGGKWIILVRFHYKLLNQKNNIKFNKKIINVSNYPDMQELLCISDIGITDYSSWMCDYVLTGKPGFLYAADYEKYKDGRGFYYSLESTPFEVCINNDILEEKIKTFNSKEFKKKVEKFLEDRGCYEVGDASKKTVNLIEKLMKY